MDHFEGDRARIASSTGADGVRNHTMAQEVDRRVRRHDIQGEAGSRDADLVRARRAGKVLRQLSSGDLHAGSDSIGCLNAIAGPQAIPVMLTALFAFVIHASRQKAQS